jgi:hypothetical protein
MKWLSGVVACLTYRAVNKELDERVHTSEFSFLTLEGGSGYGLNFSSAHRLVYQR